MPLILLILLVGYLVFYPAKPERNPIAINAFLKPMTQKVEVISLVKQQKCYESFTIKPINQDYYYQASWFSCDLIRFHVGDILEANFKLKPLHALNNPGGFDSEQWAREKNIVAQATIKSARKIGDAQGFLVSMKRLREMLDNITQSHLKNSDVIAVVESLTLGISHNLSWNVLNVFNLSGTRHLLSISGSHIAMVAMLAYFLFFLLMRIILIFKSTINAHSLAVGCAVLFVGFYVGISGEQLPTLRAFFMAGLGLVAICLNRYSSFIERIIIAAIVVIFIDNNAIYSPSFYLSFTAVFLIAYHQLWISRLTKKWKNYLSLNILLLIGLLPISLYFFSQFSFVSIIANLVAIPWAGFIILPLAILLQWLSYFGFQCDDGWLFLEWVTQGFLWLLEVFYKITADVPGVFFIGHIGAASAFILSLIVLLVFLPKGMPGKNLWVIAFLSLFLTRTELQEKEAEIIFLNVGQGLSILIKTQHHLMIYDTGPKFFTGGDVAQSIIIPYLYYRGWNHVDMMMVSHGDADHAGGVKTLRENINIKKILTSAIEKIPGSNLCEQGQRWQWDGVEFRVLYPDSEHQHLGNNSSCVLKISTGETSVLLVGDIEQQAEKFLAKTFANDLPSRLISVPHHGSKTSSSEEFLLAVHPDFAVFSYGFLNRFHFPSPYVMRRYGQLKIQPLVTESGPVFVVISPQNLDIHV